MAGARNLPARPTDERGQPLDGVGMVVALARVAEEKVAAAERLSLARSALSAAKLDRANELLADAIADYGERAEELLTARGRAERRYAELATTLIALDEAAEAENASRRVVVRIAKGGLTTDEARDRLQRESAHELPVQLDADGSAIERVERPSVGLFDGGDRSDPRMPTFWSSFRDLFELARKHGRERALAEVGDELRAALIAAEQDDDAR
jgi:hypothetical protein